LARKTQIEILREAEKKLASDLSRLRKQIKSAERGENTRVKNANKYIAKTLKAIEKTSREQEKIREKELSKLEKFLGDSFETLTEARQALVKQTAKPTKREYLAEALNLRKKAESSSSAKEKQRKIKLAESYERAGTGKKLDPKKPVYKVRQLSELEEQSIIDFLTDRKTFNEVGLGYLADNERITVSVPYQYYGTDGRTHKARALGRRIFRDWKAFQAYLISYMTDDVTEDWIGEIEIIKFDDEYTYRVQRGRQTDQIHDRRKAVKKLFREREKKKITKAKKTAYESGFKKGQIAKQRAKELKQKLKGRK